MSARPLKLFLIAGEASGDRLGAALMRGLKAELAERGQPDRLDFEGVGGGAMAAEGLTSRFPINDIAVMGVAEVLPRLPTILRRIRETVDGVIAARPDAVVTIDAPDFGLRVARKAGAALGDATTFIHFVAPSVWAWRPKRAEKMARSVDHLMALLPFEPPYFHRVGLSCDFVGHPIVEATDGVDPSDRSLRAEIGVADDAPLVLALPGSRRSEVSRLAEPFGAALGMLARRRPNLQVALPVAETIADTVIDAVADWPVRPHLIDPRGRSFAEAERRKFQAMAVADAALAASGSVSLELAAMRTPTVVGYRTGAITAAIVRRMLKIDTATLTNLITDTRTVPEFLQERCHPEALSGALDRLLDPNAPERAAQLAAADEALRQLGRGGPSPSRRAARSVLAAIDRGADPTAERAAPAD